MKCVVAFVILLGLCSYAIKASAEEFGGRNNRAYKANSNISFLDFREPINSTSPEYVTMLHAALLSEKEFPIDRGVKVFSLQKKSSLFEEVKITARILPLAKSPAGSVEITAFW